MCDTQWGPTQEAFGLIVMSGIWERERFAGHVSIGIVSIEMILEASEFIK